MKPAFNVQDLMDTAAAVTSGVHGYHDREDAQQEFILGALEAQAREKRGKAVRALQWGYGTGYVKKFLKANQDHLEHVKTVLDSPAGSVEDPATLASFLPVQVENPLDATARNEATHRVRVAVKNLPAKVREVILARYFQGKTLEEIAKTKRVTKEWVRKLEEQGLARLRTKLARVA